MNFLNPWMLLGGLGIALPILAHLLNKHQFKQTDWAAMQFLSRAINVRSRQIKLRDLLLLVLRCLAVLLLVLAISRPILEESSGTIASKLGERRAGVIIALDASFSMQHSDGTSTRFEQALEKIGMITRSIHPGDPVCLVLLGAEHRVIARNMAFDPGAFDELLLPSNRRPSRLISTAFRQALKALARGDGCPAEGNPHRDRHAGSGLEATGRTWLRDAFENLTGALRRSSFRCAAVPDNLAITGLELVSGVLRKDTIARYRATVRNFGTSPVLMSGSRDWPTTSPWTPRRFPSSRRERPRRSRLFVPFHNAGPVRISAELEADPLPADNARRTVAVIRDEVSVLIVEGSSAAPAVHRCGARGRAATVRVRRTSRCNRCHGSTCRPRTLEDFDVVILADVPDITPEQAQAFETMSAPATA